LPRIQARLGDNSVQIQRAVEVRKLGSARLGCLVSKLGVQAGWINPEKKLRAHLIDVGSGLAQLLSQLAAVLDGVLPQDDHDRQTERKESHKHPGKKLSKRPRPLSIAPLS
jgi:hypothetical protein